IFAVWRAIDEDGELAFRSGKHDVGAQRDSIAHFYGDVFLETLVLSRRRPRSLCFLRPGQWHINRGDNGQERGCGNSHARKAQPPWAARKAARHFCAVSISEKRLPSCSTR